MLPGQAGGMILPPSGFWEYKKMQSVTGIIHAGMLNRILSSLQILLFTKNYGFKVDFCRGYNARKHISIK
jgi:hypothetical protein